MEITWLIEQMWVKPEEDGKPNVVVTAAWRCNGYDPIGVAGTQGGRTTFTLQQGESFTPYQDLTQDQVLQWCWDSGVDKTAVEADVLAQMQKSMNPPILTPPLPWSN